MLQNGDLIVKGIPIVAVMGPTGAGKSTFIRAAASTNDVQIGDGLTSCTQEVQVVPCHGPTQHSKILFIDTPGFDDTLKTDAEILKQIARWLQETYRKGIKLSGILYLHRITDNRMSGTRLRNLALFKELCGSDALSNVVLVTTHWDQLQDVEEGVRIEEQLRSHYWEPFLKHGSQALRFHHSSTSAWKIVNSLPMVQASLKIQREMVDQGKPLAETTAGRSLVGWFIGVTEALRKFIRHLERLTGRVKSPTNHGDGEGASRRKVLDEVKANLKEMEEQQSLLLDPNLSGQPKKGLKSRMAGKFGSRRKDTLSTPSEVSGRMLSDVPLDPPASLLNEVPTFSCFQSQPPASENENISRKVDGAPENSRWHLYNLIVRIARSRDSRKAFGDVFSKREEARFKAQVVADYLNALLHDAGILKEDGRPNILRLFCELAKSAEVYPRCYVLEGIDMDTHPFCPGGFADVYMGKYQDQVVCCKVLRLSDDEGRHASILRTFAKEIVLWAHSSHKNVLPFYGVYALGGSIQRISLVSPWMKNGNLRQYLRNSPDSTRRVPLVQDIAEGLVHLHELKVVHGDLKAENILVSDDGRALITDFGLSFVAMSVAANSGQSPTGGTTNWMAPELFSPVATPPKPTKESDIWSFGCVCYEVFTGRRPFHHYRSPSQVILALLRGEVPRRPEAGDGLVCAEFEDWTWEMMLGCWKDQPQDRCTGEVIRNLLKLKGIPDKRIETSNSQPGKASALQEAMKAQSHTIVDYQLVESILEEFLSARKLEKAHD